MKALRNSLLASLAAALFLVPSAAPATSFITGAVSGYNGGVDDGWSASTGVTLTDVVRVADNDQNVHTNLAFSLGDAETITYTPANPSDAGGKADVVISNAVFTTAYEYPGVEAVGGIDSQAAICVAQIGDAASPSYYGWAGAYTVENDVTNLTWNALSGANPPADGKPVTVTMSFNYTVASPTVTFKAGTQTLNASGTTAIPLHDNSKTQVTAVSFSGEGSLAEMTAESAPGTVVATFLDGDGSTITNLDVAVGATPVYPAGAKTPSKTATAQWTFAFDHWDPALAAISDNQTYTPVFTSNLVSYTITWLDDDDSQIDTTTVEYGVVPTHADPTKAATDEYSYSFAGWTPTVVAVTGATSYKATYTATKKSYTITWLDDDNSQIDTTTVEYGVVPTHADPTKAATDEYTYAFAGWTPTVVAVTGATSYKATYTASKNSYTITFENYDGTVLQSSSVEYGETPVYNGATPTKPADAQNTYEFDTWDPAIASVTGTATYTAQFEAHEIVTPTLALAKPTLSSTALADAQSGAVVRATIDSAAEVTGASSTAGVFVDVDGATATFTSLPWNEAVDWTLSAEGAADLPGRFYAKGETEWFNVATDALDTVTDLAEGMKGVDKKLAPSASNQMVRIQTCLEIPEGAMDELPGSTGVGSARTGFAVAQLTGDEAPAFYAYTGDDAQGVNGWVKLSGVNPAANTTNDLLIVLDVEAGTARYYVEGIALYKASASAGAPVYAIPMKAFEANETKQINGIGFANADGVKAPVVAEYDVPFEAAVGDVPYVAAAAGASAVAKDGTETLQILANLDPGVEIDLASGQSVKVKAGTFTGLTVATSVSGKMVRASEPDAYGVVTYDLVDSEATIIWLAEDGQTEIDRQTLSIGVVPVYAGTAEGTNKTATAQFTYTFAGWTAGGTSYAPGVALPAVVAGGATYTAAFTETLNSYEITWADHSGTVKTETIDYGETPTEPSTTPAQYVENGKIYTGTWPTPVAVTGPVTYNAVYNAGVTAAATVISVAQDGTETVEGAYATLAEAFAAAQDGQTVRLLADVALTDRLFVNAGATPAFAGSGNRYATTSEDKAVTLDLNGHDITSASNIALAGGSLNITNSSATAASIATTSAGLAPVEIRGTGDLAKKRTLTVGKNVTLDGGEYGLNVFGSNDAQKNLIDVTVDGTVNGTLFVLGNLTNAENEIDIVVNGTVAAPAGSGDDVNVGIALNGNADVTVNEDASVSGDSGIEVRAGTLTVNGGTIEATADAYSYKANGSGSSVKGAAVAVSQHSTRKAVEVSLGGGTFTGPVAVAVVDPETGDPASVAVALTGGTFDGDVVVDDSAASVGAIIPATVVVGGETVPNPARFSDADADGVPADYKLVADGETGLYKIEAKVYVAEVDGQGYETLAEAFSAAEGGDTVKLLADVTLTDRLFVNAGATPAYAGSNNRYATTSEDKSVTLDLNGHDITSSSNIALAGGSLAITGEGTIKTTNAGLSPVEIRGTGDLTSKRTLTIGKDVTLDGGAYGLNVFGSNDAQKNLIDVTVNGTVKGTLFVLGNLTNAENAIDIVVNGTVAAPAGEGTDVNVGIALNGNANVTVNDGANVSGDSGIEVRAGSLTVNGGTITATAASYSTITATAASYSYTANASGSTTKGAAVAVAQHTTTLPTSATLNGGTLVGVEQIGVTDVNGDMSGVTVLAAQGFTQNSAVPAGYGWGATATPGVYRLVDAGAAVWIGGAQGDWNVPGNWDIGFVPTNSTAVTFTNDAQVAIGNSDRCKGMVLVDANVALVRASGVAEPILRFYGNGDSAVTVASGATGALSVNNLALFNERTDSASLTIGCGFEILGDVTFRGVNPGNNVSASFTITGKTTISANALVKTIDYGTTKFQGGIEVAKGVTAKIATKPHGTAQIGTGVTLVANDGAGAPTAIWLMQNEGTSRGVSLVGGASVAVDADHAETYYVKTRSDKEEYISCDIYEATPKRTVVSVAATGATVTGVTSGQRFVPGDKFTVEVSGLAEGHEAVLVIKKHSDGSELVNTKALPYEYTTPDFDVDVSVTAPIKTFTVIWVVEGEVPVTNTVEYGTETATFKPVDPSKPATASAIYTFTGWSPDVAATVTQDATYTAQFDTATPVAMIGDAYYASLADAVAAVPEDGTETTIMMLADETINVTGYALTVPASKNVVLDLNGKTVIGACSESGTSALIRNLGTLTINDSSDDQTGKLIGGADPTWTWDGSDDYSGSYASNLIRNEGTLVVNGGTLYNASSGSAAYAIDNYGSGTVTINGGTVDAKKASAIRMFYNNGGSVTVTDGTIGHYTSDSDCTYMGIQVMSGNNADVSISGGTIAGMYAFYGTGTGNSSVSISGGTFDGYVGFGSAMSDDIAITGGEFWDWVGTWGDQTEFISGGTFYVEPEPEYVVQGSAVVKNGDFWTIGDAIAEIGTIGYATLEGAFADADDGDTVKLLKNVALTDRLFVNAGVTPAYAGTGNRYATTSEDKAVTLDLNGKNITSASNIALAGGSLNITNSSATAASIETTNAGLAPVEIRGTGDLASKRTLVVGEGVTLDGGEYGLNVFGSNDAQKNLIDVTVNGTVNGSLFVLGNLKNAENEIDIVVNGTVAAPAGSGDDVNVGIALNGNANVTVNAPAQVSGDSGIEVRAGSLTVNGGTITANAQTYSYTPNGSGSTTKGAAVAVAQHTTKLATSATLNGGTLSGVEQIGVTDVNGDMSGVTVLATEGYTQNSAIPEDYKWVETETAGTYTLAAKEYVAQVFAGETAGQKYESLAAALAAAGDGDTVVLLANVNLTDRLFVNAGATPAYAGSGNRYATTSEDKALTLDLNGKNITSSSNIALAGGTLNITGTGTIETTNAGLAPVEIRGTGNLASKRTLTIGEDVTLDGGEYGLNVFGSNDAQKNLIDVTVNGTVNGSLFVLGNLTNAENDIDIVVNGTVAAPAGEGTDVNVGARSRRPRRRTATPPTPAAARRRARRSPSRSTPRSS